MNPVFAKLLYIAIFISQWLCGLATVTSVSRMIFAFSRDGGLPFSKALASVSKAHRTPVSAIWTGSILSVLFVWGTTVISIAGSSAYSIVVSCTVIFLFLSFTVPIALGLFAHGTPKWNKIEHRLICRRGTGAAGRSRIALTWSSRLVRRRPRSA